jgi:cytochrome P450
VNATDVLARFGRSGTLPWWLAPIFRFGTGFRQALTTEATVTALLDRPGVTVPYGPRAQVLGLETFPLALDGGAHDTARQLVQGALGDAAARHHAAVRDLRGRADELVVGATGRIELIGGLVDPCLTAWVEHWFGLDALGHRLLRCSRAITHSMFFNPPTPKGPVDEAGLARLVAIVETDRAAVAAAVPAAPSGTLAAALLARCGGDAHAAASHVLGSTVGPLALGSWALALALDDLLDRPWILDSVIDEAHARAAFAGALARRPPLPGLPRDNPSGFRIDPDGIDVPAGRVLAATACATKLADPPPADLPFGHGPHACLGIPAIHDVAAPLVAALARRYPRRAAGPAGRLTKDPGPSGVRSWPFPGRLEVTLAS